MTPQGRWKELMVTGRVFIFSPQIPDQSPCEPRNAQGNRGEPKGTVGRKFRSAERLQEALCSVYNDT